MKAIKLILPFLIAIAGCKQSDIKNLIAYKGTEIDSIDVSKAKHDPKLFHVRVSHFMYNSYEIRYTVDGWETYQSIMTTFDLGYSNIPVSYQQEIFDNYDCEKALDEAVVFAKQFKTYEDCLKYNTGIRRKYWRLLEYRKAHPIKEKPAIIDKPKFCTKEINVL